MDFRLGRRTRFHSSPGFALRGEAPDIARMSEDQLRNKLAELHRELADTERVDVGTRELLEELLADVLHALERTDAPRTSEDHASLSDRAQALAGELEGSHPTVATAIGRVVDALSNLGI